MGKSLLPTGPACRIGTGWRRSSASIPLNDCVEVCASRENVRVRDSKGQQAVELQFGPTSWASFLSQWNHAE